MSIIRRKTKSNGKKQAIRNRPEKTMFIIKKPDREKKFLAKTMCIIRRKTRSDRKK
jgi:hypothetical protein